MSTRHDDRTSSTSSTRTNHNQIDVSDIDQKQLELRGAVEHRISTLERAVLAREQQVAALERQLRKLEEDYQYNYNLISERDRAIEEAAAYVVTFDAQLKQSNHELNLARQALKSAEGQRDGHQQQLRQMQIQHESRMTDIRKQMESMQRAHRQELLDKETELQEAKEAVQVAYASRVADEDRARSIDIASLEAAAQERTEAFKRQERLLLNELQEWRERHDTLRDEVANVKQDLATSQNALEVMTMERERCERQLSEARKDHDVQKDEVHHHAIAIKDLQSKLSQLLTEKQSLAMNLSASEARAEQLDQRLSLLDATKENQTTKFEEACAAMRKAQEETMARLGSALKEAETKLRTSQDHAVQLEQTLSERTSQLDRSVLEVSSLKSQVYNEERHTERARLDAEKWHREVATLQERCDAQDAAAEDLQRRHVEAVRLLNVKVQDASEALDQLRTESGRKLQACQSEVSRITRELQASEAARQALESQVHALRDDAGLQYQYNRVLREKGDLEQRVIELQTTNEAIRQQVNTFTAELQNDPVIKNAKVSAQQVSELKTTVVTLEQRIQERDETIRRQSVEMRRYQEEILSEQTNLRSLQHLAGDHAKLKQELEETQRSKNLALSTEEADGDNRTVEALKEAEFWRQRAKQVEAALREAVNDRDEAIRRAQDATHALDAARSEKRSLTDVNNMLKAQLKQSYADASNVAASKAIAAPVLANVAPNTHGLAVDKVARDQQEKLLQLEDAVSTLRHQISQRRSVQRPTLSSEARRHAPSLSISKKSSSTEAPLLHVDGSSSGGAVSRRGFSAVRHYGIQQQN